MHPLTDLALTHPFLFGWRCGQVVLASPAAPRDEERDDYDALYDEQGGEAGGA